MKSGLRRFDFTPGGGAFFLLKLCGAKIIMLVLAQAFGMAACRVVKTRFDALDLCGERSVKSVLRRFDFAPGRGAFFCSNPAGQRL